MAEHRLSSKSLPDIVMIKIYGIDGLVQERRNSIANALELRLSFTNPWISSQRLLFYYELYDNAFSHRQVDCRTHRYLLIKRICKINP